MINLYQNKMPVYEMMSGASIAIAALLLIIPGFFTDLIGFLLLIPFTRKIFFRIAFKNKPMTDISAAIENQGKLEVFKMENNLANLATISGAAPMIGFLGTVIGMIVAFHEMASAGGNIDVEMLSKGIYTAMTTTVAGLVVGIIAFIAYNYLVSKVDKVVFMLEAKTTEFLDLLHHNE